MDDQSPTQAWSATRAGLAQAIGSIDGVLPGSVVVRKIPCGKPGCACKSDPDARHGPYIQWTRSVRGRTITRFLSQEQLDRYRPWFDNARRLKDLLAKLEVASIQAFESSEVPRAKPQPLSKPQRRQRPTPPSGG
ncbi:MAG: DUF6788 family protein [Actinomycetes bacterium]